jgi:hypothetical protein
MAKRFGVLPILRGLGGKLMPQRVIESSSEADAARTAHVMASVVGGAVTFSRTDKERPVITGQYGEVPPGLTAE